MMSALSKLIALERKAEAFGFEWPNRDAIIDQVVSECDEIRQSLNLKEGQSRLQEEVGDLLHAAISLCVFEGLDVEQILADITAKFEKRLDALRRIAQDRGYDSLKTQSFDVLLELWDEAKVVVKEP